MHFLQCRLISTISQLHNYVCMYYVEFLKEEKASYKSAIEK